MMVQLTIVDVMISNWKSSVSLDEMLPCKTMSLKCGIIESEHDHQKCICFIRHCRPSQGIRLDEKLRGKSSVFFKTPATLSEKVKLWVIYNIQTLLLFNHPNIRLRLSSRQLLL